MTAKNNTTKKIVRGWAVVEKENGQIIGHYHHSGAEVYWSKREARKRWKGDTPLPLFIPCTIHYKIPAKKKNT